MKKTQKRVGRILLLAAVTAMLIATVALAGSSPYYFNHVYNGQSSTRYVYGYKSDWDPDITNYADVYVTGGEFSGYSVYFRVTDASGSVQYSTGSTSIGGVTNKSLPYKSAYGYNGDKYLEVKSYGFVQGIGGVFYP